MRARTAGVQPILPGTRLAKRERSGAGSGGDRRETPAAQRPLLDTLPVEVLSEILVNQTLPSDPRAVIRFCQTEGAQREGVCTLQLNSGRLPYASDISKQVALPERVSLLDAARIGLWWNQIQQLSNNEDVLNLLASFISGQSLYLGGIDLFRDLQSQFDPSKPEDYDMRTRSQIDSDPH